MALALDEPSDDDQSEQVGGFDFIVNKDLLQRIGGVSIDVSYMGFIVQPDTPLSDPNSGCNSCAGSCAV